MTAKKENPAESAADREIVITRLLDAPRELVFSAWTDGKHIGNWWGPRGFTITTQSREFRVGGVWRFVMHGPDGRDYQNRIRYTAIEEPSRLAYEHGGEDGDPVSFLAEITFETAGRRTRLTLRCIFPTAEERERVVREHGAIEGGNQTIDRFTEHLCSRQDALAMAAAPNDFFISRVFAAPRELVWKAWTNPRHTAKWWGPTDFTNPVCDMDVRVGGGYHIVMRAPDGVEYPLQGKFIEISEPARLVMSMDCSGHPESWHDLVNPNRDRSKPSDVQMVQNISFEEIDGRTKLTIHTQFDSTELRNNMVKVGMTQGWSLSLDRLAAELGNMNSGN